MMSPYRSCIVPPTMYCNMHRMAVKTYCYTHSVYSLRKFNTTFPNSCKNMILFMYLFPPQRRSLCDIFKTVLMHICTLKIIIIIIILTPPLLCVACCVVFIYLSRVNNVRHVLSLLTVIRAVLNSFLVNRL